MSAKIQVLADMLDVIKACYPEDVSIALFDNEKLIAQIEGDAFKDKLIPIGTPLENISNTVSYRALKTKQKLREERAEELFGFPYIGIATPIWDGGEVVGVLTVLTPTTKIENLKKHAEKMNAMVQQSASLFEGISAGSNKTNELLKKLAEESEVFTNSMKEIYNILNIIKDVSARTNLLGLNAAIEATRAGTHGSGFTVVANEIRKLADHSKVSVDNVQQQLQEMQTTIETINQSIQNIAEFIGEHTNSVDEFNDIFKELTEIAVDLNEQARI